MSAENYRQVQEQLDGLRRRQKTVAILEGMLLWLSAVSALWLVVLPAEALFWLPSNIRIAMTAACIGILGFIFIRWIGFPLYSLFFKTEFPDDDALALSVGERIADVKDRLANAVQVYRARTGAGAQTSPMLASMALQRVCRNVTAVDFRRPISWRKVICRTAVFAATGMGLLLILILYPDPLEGAFYRLVRPHLSFARPLPYQISLSPGSIRVIEGEDVRIDANVVGNAPETLILTLAEEGRPPREITLVRPFRYQLTALKNDIEYAVHDGRFRTPVYRIDVVHRPLIRRLDVRLSPPPYARLGVQIQETNLGDVSILRGTGVQITAVSNKTLSRAFLSFDKNPGVEMRVAGRRAEGDFIVRDEDQYRVHLTDTSGITNEHPIVYTIRVQPDLDPVARISFPGRHVDLDDAMRLALTLEGEDDFGLSDARLGYRIRRSSSADSQETTPEFVPLTLQGRDPLRMLIHYDWDLGSLDLFPEDVVAYFLEVWDNDTVSGPKRSRSRTFTARFPSMFEIFQEVESAQTSHEEILEEVLNESRELRDEFARISEEIKSGMEVTWEDRKQLEEMSDTQNTLTDEIEKLRESLDDLVDRMDRYDLLNLKTLDKYQELQALFNEIASPELSEAIKKLQEAMSRVDQEQLRRAAEGAQFSQEAFLESIERTLSLLKRLRVEQKVDEIVKRLENLVERQEKINRAIPGSDPSELADLSNEEQGVAEDVDDLSREMKNLQSIMEGLPGMPVQETMRLMERLEDSDLAARLTQASDLLAGGDTGRSASLGNQAEETLKSMLEMASSIQENLQRNQMARITEGLRRASYRLIRLSKEQENLMTGTQEGRVPGSTAASEQYALLMGVDQVADSLVALSRETFFVTPEMGKALGEARSQMKRTIQLYEQSGGNGAVTTQGHAMGGLNRTVIAIQEAMNQLQQAESGLGMEAFFQQLEQMTVQQMGINQRTLDLFNQGRLTLEQQASMERLAAEQEVVRRAMQELMEEYGNRSELSGRLDRMIEDMEEVVRELRQGQARPETIRRQEQILSRLLDAQRSVRRRDYSRQRRARTGVDVVRSGPASLPLKIPDWREQIRRDILRLSREGFTKDYQELIRLYFEALTREEKD